VKNEFKLDVFSNVPSALKAEAVTEPVVEPVVVKPVVEEPVVNAAPDLSIYTHQLELNKRK
jgi:hypothetical protein